MDYKYIEQLVERYFDAETSLEEEQILRSFFSQEDIPAEMQQWAPLFAYKDENMLGDDFEARILQQIGETQQTAVVKAKEVKLTQYLMPLFKAAAVVAIILTLGGALQAPWDNSWDDPREYAVRQQIDTVAAVQPIQAENMSDKADSTSVMMSGLPKD
jgi:hypothetical protein